MRLRKSILRSVKVSCIVSMIGLLLSCDQNNPQPNSTVLKWNISIDGQNYSWQGNYPSTTGLSRVWLHNTNNVSWGQVKLTKDSCFHIELNAKNLTHVGSYSPVDFYIIPWVVSTSGTEMISSQDCNGTCITLNITDYPQNSNTGNRIIKGNFSGTASKPSGQIVNISGSFESILDDW
jgi:hypothetical protein